MPHYDLDARRRAVERTTIEANGHSYELPAYMPATIMTAGLALTNAADDPAGAAQGARDTYASLFGEDLAEQAMRDIALDEVFMLVDEVYQVDLGKLQASAAPSKNGGNRLKPTSRASTRST